jgi:DNA modification methylase
MTFPELTTPLSRFRDSAFMENRDEPVHRWIPWIAGFSTAFVEDCLRAFLPRRTARRACVLDPFAGVGTTLVTAVASGLDAVGFEINPYAALACRVKADSPKLDVRELDRCRHEYETLCRNGARTAEGVRPEDFVTRIPFFSPEVEKQVFGFLAYVNTIRNTTIADLFRLAFGAVMVSFSNYTYEPSLCSRPGAGKPLIENADVHAGILRRLAEMALDIRWFQDDLAQKCSPGSAVVHEMSFMDSTRVLAPGSIDLAVTSPPYMNNYHYVRSTRPQMFWLNLVSSREALRRLEQENVGKYWQTVRDAEPVRLDIDDPELESLLEVMRSTRSSEGAYGGPGWANYVASYINDSNRFLAALKPSLRRGATAVIVIGNSIIQGHEVKVDKILESLARRLGYTVVGNELLRTKRVGSSITKSTVRRGQASPAALYECAVIIRRKFSLYSIGNILTDQKKDSECRLD